MTQEEFDTLSKEIYFCDGMCGINYKYKSCVAEVASGIRVDGRRWATIYVVESAEPNQGHCQTLLRWLQYKFRYFDFGCTVALNDKMRHILQKLNIKEYR